MFLTGLICFVVGAVGGFVAGFLVFRNNAAKISDAEKQAVDIANKFKS